MVKGIYSSKCYQLPFRFPWRIQPVFFHPLNCVYPCAPWAPTEWWLQDSRKGEDSQESHSFHICGRPLYTWKSLSRSKRLARDGPEPKARIWNPSPQTLKVFKISMQSQILWCEPISVIAFTITKSLFTTQWNLRRWTSHKKYWWYLQHLCGVMVSV